jgi:aminopeptidase YwaD
MRGRSFVSGLSAGIILFVFFCFSPASATAQQDFQKIISWLTADELKGRYAGSVYDSVVQQYIAKHFEQSNASFLPGHDSYIQGFSFQDRDFYTGEIEFQEGGQKSTLIHQMDFHFGTSVQDTVTLDCVFIGYGIDPSILHTGELEGKAVIKFVNRRLDESHSNLQDWLNTFPVISDRALIQAGVKAIIYVLPEARDFDSTTYPQYKNIAVLNTSEYPSGRPDRDQLIRLFTSREIIERIAGTNLISRYYDDISAQKSIGSIPLGNSITLSCRKYHIFLYSANVSGMLEGTGDDYLIIGAHHDHLRPRNGAIFPGANDNASGVAMLLELIAYFSTKNPDCKLVFVAFGAEEKGLLGSEYFFNHLPFDSHKIKAMINLDMLGELSDDTLYYNAFSFDNWDHIKTTLMDKDILSLKKEVLGASDHLVFAKNNIPTIFLSTGSSPRLHSPEDKEMYINYQGMEQIFLVLTMLVELLSLPEQG